ncbi:MAG: hypothetical protein ABR599_02135 [Gemmatimonadota bacterium]
MSGALRLQALSLPVEDLEATSRFYRWSFRMEPVQDADSVERAVLGWGAGEDRLQLRPERVAEEGEALALRMPAMAFEDAVRWCREREMDVEGACVSPDDLEAAAALLPAVPLRALEDARAANLSVLRVRGPGGGRLDLVFPLPAEVVVGRGLLERFWWRSGDWSGLETPGLLGVTWGSPHAGESRRLFERLGLAPLDRGDDSSPLRVGDQQVVVEEREREGVHAFALVLPLARLAEVKRALEHLRAPVREAGNRLLTRDPDGRPVLVHGARGG